MGRHRIDNGCVNGAACDNEPHPGWFHATDWKEVEMALDQGLIVADADGDEVYAVGNGDGLGADARFVGEDADAGPGQPVQEAMDWVYPYMYFQLRINGQPLPPVTEDEERDVLASIAKSFQILQD